jgi:hypothetical protein
VEKEIKYGRKIVNGEHVRKKAVVTYFEEILPILLKETTEK